MLFSHTVAGDPPTSWEAVGQRVQDARRAAGHSQVAAAAAIGLDRTALAKVESGRRNLSSLEFARLARLFGRPIEWFVLEASPAVLSRRSAHGVGPTQSGLDRVIESFARDVEMLLNLEALTSQPRDPDPMPTDLAEAERLADDVRARLGLGHAPAHDLLGRVERLGLHALVVELGADNPDGAYVALDAVGATVINGSHPPGRRRFTLAHELGHHLLHDEFSTDWTLAEPVDTREKLINAFAVHLLLPRAGAVAAWRRHEGARDPRDAAIHLGVEYRLSWSAACAQLRNLGLLDPTQHANLACSPPTRADHLERELFIVEELQAPAVSPRYGKAVLRAFRGHKLGANRAVAMLHGTVGLEDLPMPNEVPREALRGELARR